MDFRDAPDVGAWRTAARAFLAAAMAEVGERADPDDLTGVDEPFERRLHEACGARGYLDAPPARQAAFNFEVAAAGAPVIDTAMTAAGQPIIAFGSPAQHDYFLPRMRRGELAMCIAYTEEQAGSDLSAIVMRAEADVDGYLLNGTKVMVTGAHKADWCCTVARTRPDGPAREALTMFLVDMGARGVRVERRPTMNGWTLDSVHFVDVHVGPDAVLGERDGGWRQLVSAVHSERSGSFYLGMASDVLSQLVEYVGNATRDGMRLADDPLVRDRVAGLSIELAAGMRLATRTTWLHERGESTTVAAAMSKVYATELLQRLAQAATEIAGLAGTIRGPLFGAPSPHAAAGGRFAYEYLERVHGTISVGANELQRDTIAGAGLGLPRPGRR